MDSDEESVEDSILHGAQEVAAGETSQQSFDVPVREDETDDSVGPSEAEAEYASEDEYEQPIAGDSGDDGDEDFEPEIGRKAPVPKASKSAATARRGDAELEVVVAVTARVGSDATGVEPESMALDKSMVMRPGMKTKPKR